MIQPTIGRIVWAFKDAAPGDPHTMRFDGPYAAIIAGVHDERTVDVWIFEPNHLSHCQTSIPLIQPGDEGVPDAPWHCEWMPYQVKKTTGSESGEVEVGSERI